MPSPTAPPQPLLTATRSTFEALAMLLAEATAAPPDDPPGYTLLGEGARAARVAFSGVAHVDGRPEAAEGALRVAVSADLAVALATNMLGLAHVDSAECRDAVGELANVVCGNVLPLLAGCDAVFCLSAPAPVAVMAPDEVPNDPPNGALHAMRCEAWFDVEGGRAHVVLDAPAVLLAPAA